MEESTYADSKASVVPYQDGFQEGKNNTDLQAPSYLVAEGKFSTILAAIIYYRWVGNI